MANLLWGKVYYQQHYAGRLQQEPGDRTLFEYDQSYLDAGLPSIAYTLPTTQVAHHCQAGLHPFFDNLVAEGWLESAQTRMLGKRSVSRFELLLAFGYDCAGAVSVLDPKPEKLTEKLLDETDTKEFAALKSRASLSGVQPKLAVIKKNKRFCPAPINTLSTHIAKFPSQSHPDLIYNEYLSTKAFQALLPHEQTVQLHIAEVTEQDELALVIKRFDRINGERLHFEEFNQLLGFASHEKYEADYVVMSRFILDQGACLPAENYRLFERILGGLLLGNTDMHLKNFAMFHTPEGLRLTPAYDLVAASLYRYKTIALSLIGIEHLNLGELKAKHIIAFGHQYGLSNTAIGLAMERIEARLSHAKEAIENADHGHGRLKEQLISLMEKRWKGTFASIGQRVSKKQ